MQDFENYKQADYAKCLKGASDGNLYAKARLAVLLLNKNPIVPLEQEMSLIYEVVRVDPIILHLIFKSALERGEVGAMYGSYILWEGGIGTNVNKKIAFKYLKRAAKKGYTFAESNLGAKIGYFSEMSGQRRNDRKALKYLKRAASKNFPEAHRQLYFLLNDQKNFKKQANALKHLHICAKLDPSAFVLNELSYVFRKSDPTKSAMWDVIRKRLNYLSETEFGKRIAGTSSEQLEAANLMATQWMDENIEHSPNRD